MKHYLAAIGMGTFGLLSGGCSKAHPQTTPAAMLPEQQPELQTTISVTPELPSDIPGGAPNATLTQAAFFAWQEFISLNWPAVPQTSEPGTRDQPDATQKFGAPDYSGPLTWHTYRGKAEIFPGMGAPPGGSAQVVNGVTVLGKLPSGEGYGYDFEPTYIYQNGPIPPANGIASPSTPWVNLDENSEIGLDKIYAGVAAANPGPLGNQLLFAAKANRAEFDYIAPKGWWDSKVVPFTATQQYLATNKSDPPAGSATLVSLSNGTVELKSAWRKLASSEDSSRFYTTKVRYYVQTSSGVGYVDDTFALIALHIIQKTPTAPYFIFATFEQADAITDASGKPVEDADGTFIGTPVPASPLTPNIVSTNATPTTVQTFAPTQSNVQNAQGQLYYQNIPAEGLTTGTILVNQRQHPIPAEVIAVNATAHQVIADYMQQNFPAGTTSPWAYYKLINVQSKPIAGKVPGVTYAGADAATYYQANSVVETDYNLQVFSGRFTGNGGKTEGNTITDYTDFTATEPGVPFDNVVYDNETYNMGGCMGCHGNAQHGGADFSFILQGGRVTTPDTAGPASTQSLARFKALFHP